jgi:hypothetical protein
VLLVGGGTPSLLFGLIGYRMRRAWVDREPSETAADFLGAFQLGRQQSLMKRAPFWTSLGVSALGVGVVLIVVGKLTGQN